MSRLEDTRRVFIQSIETDYPAFDHDGSFTDSVAMELAAKEFRVAAEKFATVLNSLDYAVFPGGRPLTCTEDAVQAFIDAFTWDIRGEALSFLHEAGKGVE